MSIQSSKIKCNKCNDIELLTLNVCNNLYSNKHIREVGVNYRDLRYWSSIQSSNMYMKSLLNRRTSVPKI